MATSAGLILYRHPGAGLEILLVHPGGPFWKNRDRGVWMIPKGEIDADEDPLAAAVREFAEETGMRPTGPFAALTPIRQKGGKIVHAWACAGEFDPDALVSSTFTLEWPPRSGRMATFPEVDRAAWFPLAEARSKILPSQLPLLDQIGSFVYSS
ncbi:MAG: NUDIX domain-containing protein [Gemmatimonadota bacterium]